jgi:hypothetical protein
MFILHLFRTNKLFSLWKTKINHVLFWDINKKTSRSCNFKRFRTCVVLDRVRKAKKHTFYYRSTNSI